MRTIERKIVDSLLEQATHLPGDIRFKVHNGAEWLRWDYDASGLTRSWTRSPGDILANLEQTGMDTLYVYSGDQRLGWVTLIWGNGEDLISDYSDNPDMEALCASVLCNL